MTQLRKHKDAISNELDQILSGIAPRGCSFTDVDALFHDDPTNRFLMMELKRPGEALSRGQGLALAALAHEPRITVWYVQLWANGEHGQIAWADFRAFDSIEYLTVDQFRARVDAWWKNRYHFTGTSDVEYTAQSWFEMMDADPGLRHFVDAEVARACVELSALRVETKHWKLAAEAATRKLQECEHRRRLMAKSGLEIIGANDGN